jgi:hypothetical protein
VVSDLAAPPAARLEVLAPREEAPLMPDNRSEDQHDPDERIRTIVLAEFSGLRGEIATRVNLLATMIIANLTVLGVVFGIALNSGNTILGRRTPRQQRKPPQHLAEQQIEQSKSYPPIIAAR